MRKAGDKPLYYEEFFDTSETEPTVPAAEVAEAVGAEIVGAATDARRLNAGFAGRHSMNTPEWYTPAPFVEAAREVMGGIDLDPASCEAANRVVQATRYFTVDDDGLAQDWHGRVFLNPPGGKRAGTSLTKLFWQKLIQQRNLARVDQAIWIGYSLEQLQTLQGDLHASPLAFSMCVPKRRIAFVSPEGGKNSPSHGNFITYIGPNKAAFLNLFGVFGQVAIR